MHRKFTSEAEWLALRDAHVGGSEVSALFNLWRLPDGSEVVRHLFEAVGPDDVCIGTLSPYTTGYRLYMEKAGRLAPENLDHVERIKAGQHLEPAIAAWANERWPDWGLRKSRVYHVSDRVEGMGASLDYFDRQKRPVDVKNVDGFIFKQKWTVSEATGEVIDFPLAIVLQVQHQIACFGGDAGGVLACVGGNELRRGFIPRHQPTIDKIETAVAAFWAAIQMGVEPLEADYGTVAEVYAFGESKDSAGPPVDWRGNPDASRALRQYQRWSRFSKRVDQHVDLFKGRLAQHMGEHYSGLFDEGRVTWPTIRREAGAVSYTVPAKTYRGALTVSKPKA